MNYPADQAFFQLPQYNFLTIWEKLSQELIGYFLLSSFQIDIENENRPIMFITAMHLMFPHSLFEFEVLVDKSLEQEAFIEYAKKTLLDEYDAYIKDYQERLQTLAMPEAPQR